MYQKYLIKKSNCDDDNDDDSGRERKRCTSSSVFKDFMNLIAYKIRMKR